MAGDSDSPLSDVGSTTPPDSEIERALRAVVTNAYKREDFENLTLKRVRAEVTSELDLTEDFFKVNEKWKSQSKDIVNDEVTKQEDSAKQTESAPPATTPSKSTPVKNSTSRASPKRKASEQTPEKPPAKKQRKQSLPQSSDVEDDDQEQPNTDKAPLNPPEANKNANGKAAEAELGPESELSDVLDETPPPKAKRKPREPKTSTAKPKQNPAKGTAKPKAKSKLDTATPATSAPDDEIKRLQGQLQKCGIRRVWGKELAKFDAQGEKIAHLKGMLRDVGMEGRFSEEKARLIKEERELKADLEAIQEGEERWGKGPSEQPRRLVAKGLLELEGLVDDEESD